MTTQTPAPWRARRTDRKYDHGSVSQWSFGTEELPSGHMYSLGGDLSLGGYCSDENVAIILAARELLAALRPLVECMPVGGGMVRFDGDELAAARAAIAKAETLP